MAGRTVLDVISSHDLIREADQELRNSTRAQFRTAWVIEIPITILLDWPFFPFFLLMEFRALERLPPHVGSVVLLSSKIHLTRVRHGGLEEEPRWPGGQFLPDILALALQASSYSSLSLLPPRSPSSPQVSVRDQPTLPLHCTLCHSSGGSSSSIEEVWHRPSGPQLVLSVSAVTRSARINSGGWMSWMN